MRRSSAPADSRAHEPELGAGVIFWLGGSAGTTTVVMIIPTPEFDPMFADGTTPFIGDYVDIAAPNLIYEESGGWRFATGTGEVQVWQAVWSPNR